MAVTGALPATAETYLNESQALAVLFGDHVTVRREQKVLDPSTRTKLEHASNLEFPEMSYTFFTNDEPGHATAYAVVMNEIGKSEPITFMVGMNSQGKVTDVVVMVFRENRGWEVKEKRFLNQFHGKSLHNSIRVNEDIVNYTGATLSSKAVARGVKRALVLRNEFYPPQGLGRSSTTGQMELRPFTLPLATIHRAGGPIHLYRQRRLRMGTVCEIRAWTASSQAAQKAFAAGFAELERIEQIYSAHRKDSELALVNREAGDRAVEVGEEFFALTRYAKAAHRRSGGSFDISVRPLMSIWGLRTGNARIPSPRDLADALDLVGSDKIILGADHKTVRFKNKGMELDFGGLAKGYAAQRTANLLREPEVIAALVNLGGSSISSSASIWLDIHPGERASGYHAIGTWTVGVRSPRDPNRSQVHFLLKPGSCVATSGTYESRFEIDGKTFSHLMNPRTGMPLEGLQSITAVTASGNHSEALGKVLLFSAPHQRWSAVHNFGEAAWIHIDGSSPDHDTVETNLAEDHLEGSVGFG